jgi:hypothetical protein
MRIAWDTSNNRIRMAQCVSLEEGRRVEAVTRGVGEDVHEDYGRGLGREVEKKYVRRA